MPSNQSPLGALPARFRRQRVLVVGCGDVGMRLTRLTTANARVTALTSSPARLPALRMAGVHPLVGNLDDPGTVARLAGIAHRVVHLAPPPQEGWTDPRTHGLLLALRRRTLPRSFVYASTSGVYGDCAGAWVDETRRIAPRTPRAQRRADAEARVRAWGRATGVATAILRIPGIYAPDREGGTPRERLLKGTPVLRSEDDVFTNHIHADDLARACFRAMYQLSSQRIYNVSDDTEMRMGDYFDLAADLYGMARPPRIPRDTAKDHLPLMLLSFMSESRRLINQRMRAELGVRLRYPTVAEGLSARSA